ncbi:hypothetical protein E2C01_011959 [Portunus trituberculatus]|uniref:Uncharacterized protein n=1 Tax=Portunus trituberculatus TaxID=210409 RepID=A0A5B7DC97_PORTR|nr:hypothetical protein [Portunus trituberculatus]
MIPSQLTWIAARRLCRRIQMMGIKRVHPQERRPGGIFVLIIHGVILEHGKSLLQVARNVELGGGKLSNLSHPPRSNQSQATPARLTKGKREVFSVNMRHDAGTGWFTLPISDTPP